MTIRLVSTVYGYIELGRNVKYHKLTAYASCHVTYRQGGGTTNTYDIWIFEAIRYAHYTIYMGLWYDTIRCIICTEKL